jgi:hypothetical protein
MSSKWFILLPNFLKAKGVTFGHFLRLCCHKEEGSNMAILKRGPQTYCMVGERTHPTAQWASGLQYVEYK